MRTRSTFKSIGEIAAELVHALAAPVPAHAVGRTSRREEGADDNADRETENGEAEQHLRHPVEVGGVLIGSRAARQVDADPTREHQDSHAQAVYRREQRIAVPNVHEDARNIEAGDASGENEHPRRSDHQSAPMSRKTRREKKEAVAALDTEKHPNASDDHRPKSQSPSDVGQELTGSPQPVVVFKISEHGNLYRLERLIRFCFYGRLNG